MSPDLQSWLEGLGLGQYAGGFEANAITLETLLKLTSDDLKECGVLPLGHRLAILEAVEALKKQRPAGSPAPKVVAAPAGGSPAATPGSGVLPGGPPVVPPVVGRDGLPSRPPIPAISAPEQSVVAAEPDIFPSVASAHVEVEAKPSLFARIRRAYFKASGGSMLLSIGIHAVILALGAWLVVSQVVEERKISFGGGEKGPKSEVQHKVKRKTTAPAPNKRITTTSSIAKVALPEMPNIQMNMGPSIAGAMGAGGIATASGLGGGGGRSGSGQGNGFSKVSFFGLRTSSKTGGEFVGTFYDLKQTKSREPTNMTSAMWKQVVEKFTSGPWDERELQQYYVGPNKLHVPCMFIPCMDADEGPKAFSVEKEVQPSLWLAHYKAKVVSPVSGKFRFFAGGDDIIMVRFNGQVVLGGTPKTMANPPVTYEYEGPRSGVIGGAWFSVNAGTPYDMEILIGECPGGLMYAFLLLEKANANYEKTPKGSPILPVFRLGNVVPSLMSEKDIKEQAKRVEAAIRECIGNAPAFSTKDAPWGAVAEKPVSALDALKKANEKPQPATKDDPL